MKVGLRKKIILLRKTLTRGKKKRKKKEKRLKKEIFVTYMGMEIRNVGNAEQLGISDRSVRL